LAGAGQQQGAVADLNGFFDGLHSLSADFQQVVRDPDGKLVQQSTGTVLLARPGRFRWTYETPYSQILVGDGRHVWIYDPDLEQVTVRPFQSTLGDTPAAALTSDRPLKDDFSLRDMGERDGLSWVELTPHKPNTTFAHIRIGLAKQELAAMELVDNLQQTTRLKFLAVKRNPDVPRDAFVFEPPPGVDVIGDQE
jgi:outer membrane lipoprotein carrier protein